MNFEDSRNALYVDPNAYIQKFEKSEKKQPKKVVFSEPYECMPSYYIDNDFRKGNCDCIPRPLKPHEHHCDKCEKSNNNNISPRKSNGFNFDLKSLLPLLNVFNKGNGMDFGQIANLLNINKAENNNSNPMNLISSLLSNKDALAGILNMFKGGGLNLFNKSKPTKKEIKSSDFEIKNYTRV